MVAAEYKRIKERFFRLRAEKEMTLKTIDALESQYDASIQLFHDRVAAREILTKVAEHTQNNLKYRISNLVTVAIRSIFEEDIDFEMVIESRRNKTEIDLFINEHGNLQEPLESSGHGLVDIVSLALRISYWSLKKNRGTFILDEPCRNLSRNHSVAVSKMLNTLCEKLDVQILMVSHDTEVTEFADTVFHVTKNNQVSTVDKIK